MNIKAMRNIHLYLGVFFTPLLLFFIITGCWQAFDLHQDEKGGSYHAPVIMKTLSQVHMNQRLSLDRQAPHSQTFRYLLILMAVGLLATTILGVVMAFKYTKPWLVWFFLGIGIAVPWAILGLTSIFK